jgi:transcriptional regulator with XRE-family HTH domain
MTTRKHVRRGEVDAAVYLEKMLGPLTLGMALRSTRKAEGWSQLQMAAKLGLSKSHLCDVEKNRKHVSALTAARFARILGHPVEQYVRLALQGQLERGGLHFDVIVRKSRRRRAA